MRKLFSIFAVFFALTIISAGSALAAEMQGLAGHTLSAFDNSFDNIVGPVNVKDWAEIGKDAKVVAHLDEYRQDDPVDRGENARVLALGPFPEKMDEAYRDGTVVASFLSTESETLYRANPILGEDGPDLRVGTAF